MASSPASPSTIFRLRKFLTRRKVRPLLLAMITTAIIAQIVVLSPSLLEEPPLATHTAVDPQALLPEPEPSAAALATGIPTNKIPDYSVEDFDYVSSQGSAKLWKLKAQKAHVYQQENLVHAKAVLAHLYDPDGQATLVTGREARYFMNKRDLEVFGTVKVIFPDGFEVHSEYLRYRPRERKVEIPRTYLVKGLGAEAKAGHKPEADSGQRIEFESNGLDFAMGDSKIILPEQVRFSMVRVSTGERTLIESDHCAIFRDRQLAFFTMYDSRPVDSRYVYITQPTLLSRGRRADLNYGSYSKLLNYLTLFEDVLIRERPATVWSSQRASERLTASPRPEEASLRYGTAGRADFDSLRDVIILSKYPQVYQDNDTVTGERIVVHRQTDVVEVEQSNAYSQGQPKQQQ